MSITTWGWGSPAGLATSGWGAFGVPEGPYQPQLEAVQQLRPSLEVVASAINLKLSAELGAPVLIAKAENSPVIQATDPAPSLKGNKDGKH